MQIPGRLNKNNKAEIGSIFADNFFKFLSLNAAKVLQRYKRRKFDFSSLFGCG